MKNNFPKVSVVVPVYNVERFLDRTVMSLLEQTLAELEIILVDDGSPDNCPAMCDGYADKYSKVKVVHKKNAGLGMACNSGIEVATGEFIAFCDSDDYVDKEMYEKMYDSAIKNEADAIYTGIKTVNEHGDVRMMNKYPKEQMLQSKMQIHSFAMDMIASSPSDAEERHVPMSAKVVLYRKSLIDEYKLRFVSERVIISEDLMWNVDVLCHARRIMMLPEVFYYYYNNTNSLSKKVRTDRFPFFKSMRKALIEKCNQYGMPTDVGLRIDRMFIGYSRYYLGSIINSSLSQKEKRNIVANVSKDCVWDDIWSSYPVGKMPITHRVMLWLLKHNMYVLMALAYKKK